ncbi:MBL fold metallo-hydrolase [bacterium]|nr:MAG: MBL fold metallo-hydrolase [bacterium]
MRRGWLSNPLAVGGWRWAAFVLVVACGPKAAPPVTPPPVVRPPVEEAKIAFLDVGQGDCIALRAGGRTVLIDSGPSADAGRRIVVPRLRELGWEPVSLVLISHPDRDHTAGLGEVMKRWPEAEIAASKQFAGAKDFDGFKVKWLATEGRFRLGSWTLDVVNPPLKEGAKDNDASMCLRFTDGKASAIFTGDAPIKTEDWLLAGHPWRADILKAGHHGSRTSTGVDLLAATKPAWVVFSCGKGNPYGHPTPQALKRSKEAGAQVWRTDTQGEADFVSRGGRFVLESRP